MANPGIDKRSFLLVDDDMDDIELFNEAVEAVAPAVRCINASGGKEAFAMLSEKEPRRPDVIFLDINMPVMNGWQVLAGLKEKDQLKAIPVIMYSTSMKTADLKTALGMGAICFVAKPGSFGGLKDILRIVVDHMVRGDLGHVCEALRDYRLTA